MRNSSSGAYFILCKTYKTEYNPSLMTQSERDKAVRHNKCLCHTFQLADFSRLLHTQ